MKQEQEDIQSSSPTPLQEKMFVGTWHPSVTAKAARREQKALLAFKKQHGALRINLAQAERSEPQRQLDQSRQSMQNPRSEQMTVIWP